MGNCEREGHEYRFNSIHSRLKNEKIHQAINHINAQDYDPRSADRPPLSEIEEETYTRVQPITETVNK